MDTKIKHNASKLHHSVFYTWNQLRQLLLHWSDQSCFANSMPHASEAVYYPYQNDCLLLWSKGVVGIEGCLLCCFSISFLCLFPTECNGCWIERLKYAFMNVWFCSYTLKQISNRLKWGLQIDVRLSVLLLAWFCFVESDAPYHICHFICML